MVSKCSRWTTLDAGKLFDQDLGAQVYVEPMLERGSCASLSCEQAAAQNHATSLGLVAPAPHKPICVPDCTKLLVQRRCALRVHGDRVRALFAQTLCKII